MKLNITADYEVDSGGEQGKSGKATISTTNTGAFFDMMSRSIYSDPFGSIVRELTSNCWDAHVEFKVDKAVVVGWEYHESSIFMTFEDFGIGLSPDRFENVYMSYLESTKNDSNEEIGGFGIGGKSPLSYTDIYYLRTRHEGIEYYYSISRGIDSIPEWDLLYEKKTYLPNGTLVKFVIEGGYWSDDYRKFEQAIKFQLRYFDNVYLKSFDVNNEFTVYQFDTFKYRNDVAESEMHLIVGKVAYPINWKFLKRPQINIPIGVQFNIGEIPITPNREQIRYKDDVVQIINKKIDACLEELRALARYEFDDLDEYLKWKEGEIKQIRTEKCTIPMYEGNYGTHKNGKVRRFPFKTDVVYFAPLGKVPIKIPSDPFFFLQEVGRISGGSYSSKSDKVKESTGRRRRRFQSDVPEESNIYKLIKSFTPYRAKDFKSNRMKNKYIQSGIVITKKNLKLKHYIHLLGLHETGTTHRNKRMKTVPVIGEGYNKLKLVLLYKKVMTEEFVKRSQHYDNLVIPQEFINNYQEENKRRKPQKIAGEISVLDFRHDNRVKVIRQLSDLENQMVIYGANQDRNILKALYEMINPRQSRITVIAINKNEFKMMEGANKTSLEQLVTKKNRVLCEQLTAFYIYKKYSNLKLGFTEEYIPLIKKHCQELEDFMYKCTKREYISRLLDSEFIRELLQSAVEENLLIPYWVNLVNDLTNIQKDLEVLKPIMENDKLTVSQKADVAKLLIIKGYYPDKLLLFVPDETERRWIHEWTEYSDYLKEIQIISNSTKRKLKWQQVNFQILDSNRSVRTSTLQLR